MTFSFWLHISFRSNRKPAVCRMLCFAVSLSAAFCTQLANMNRIKKLSTPPESMSSFSSQRNKVWRSAEYARTNVWLHCTCSHVMCGSCCTAGMLLAGNSALPAFQWLVILHKLTNKSINRPHFFLPPLPLLLSSDPFSYSHPPLSP